MPLSFVSFTVRESILGTWKVYFTGIYKENALTSILFGLTKNCKRVLRSLIRTICKAFPVGICH